MSKTDTAKAIVEGIGIRIIRNKKDPSLRIVVEWAEPPKGKIAIIDLLMPNLWEHLITGIVAAEKKLVEDGIIETRLIKEKGAAVSFKVGEHGSC
jgi:hypothetical protein